MGKRQGHISRTKFSFDSMVDRLKEILDTKLPKISVAQPINLPKLKSL
jgi:hypothetical protein